MTNQITLNKHIQANVDFGDGRIILDKEAFKKLLKKTIKKWGLKLEEIQKIDPTGVYFKNNTYRKISNGDAFIKLFTKAVPAASEIFERVPEQYTHSSNSLRIQSTSTWTNGVSQKLTTSVQDTSYDERLKKLEETDKEEYQHTLQGKMLSSAPLPGTTRTTMTHLTLSGKSYEFVTRTHFARNSSHASGSNASSYDRLSPVSTNMRQEEGVDGSSSFYTGRVFFTQEEEKLRKNGKPVVSSVALQQAEFLFRSELAKSQNLQKGIQRCPDGSYIFTFAVQSLLSMSPVLDGLDPAQFEESKKAYESIRDTIHLADGTIVAFEPLPSAATPFNQAQYYLGIQREFSGRTATDRANQEANDALEPIVKASQNPLAQSTFEKLQTEQDPVKQVLYRAYLCHLLKIPEVVHCKSSVDRTSVAGSAISALKQFLYLRDKGFLRLTEQQKQAIDEDITQIIDHKIVVGGQEVEVFKELVFVHLMAARKIGHLARGEDGLKCPALLMPPIVKLLPARVLKSSWIHTLSPILKGLLIITWLVAITLTFAVLLCLIPFPIYLLCNDPEKACQKIKKLLQILAVFPRLLFTIKTPEMTLDMEKLSKYKLVHGDSSKLKQEIPKLEKMIYQALPLEKELPRKESIKPIQTNQSIGA